MANTTFDTTYETTSFLIPISDLFSDVVSYVRSYAISNVRSYVLFDVKKDVFFYVAFVMWV